MQNTRRRVWIAAGALVTESALRPAFLAGSGEGKAQGNSSKPVVQGGAFLSGRSCEPSFVSARPEPLADWSNLGSAVATAAAASQACNFSRGVTRQRLPVALAAWRIMKIRPR